MGAKQFRASALRGEPGPNAGLRPPERGGRVPSPRPREHVTFFGKTVLADEVKFGGSQNGLGWALNPVTGVHIRKGKLREFPGG